MQHTCQDCDHKFFDQGQSQDSISPAVQCPQCHSYRTQPGGIPDEANDMLHGIGAMPDSTQDDMSGNPLQEGIMGDWQNRDKRDEAFSSVRRARISLFETPEFETTGLIAPPDLYRHGLEAEGSHRTGLQIPKGITDNLHATLGNLQAWVENPYENGALRPYYDQYWKVIRPSFMKPGSLQIGVADPTMAEIINHVAQTDDMTPLYEYRGVDPHTSKTAIFGLPGGLVGDAAGALGLGALNLIPGVGEAADAAALGDAAAGAAAGGEAAAGAGAAEGAAGAAGDSSASGVGGVMDKIKGGIPKGVGIEMGEQGVKSLDGGGTGGGDQVSDPGIGQAAPKDFSSYASVLAHDVPSFDPNGSGMKKFKLMLPLLQEMIANGEDGSQDPLIDGLHQSLEAEIPGYMDHADPAAGDALLLKVQSPGAAAEKPSSEDKPDKDKHDSRTSQTTTLDGDDLAEFLPALEVTAPCWRDPPAHAKTAGFIGDLFSGAFGGGGDAALAGAEGGGGAAGGTAGAVGGMMGKVLGQGKQLGQGLNYVDDFLGGGVNGHGAAGGRPDAGGGRKDMSFYTRNLFASDEDDAHPEAHDEIPKNEDGDSQQKDDGNSHEWQRDLSVDDQGGGATHAPSFDPAGPGMARLKMLAPLLIQMIEGGEDGSQDPLVLGLHQTLDNEIPGYLDHADDAAGDQLMMSLKGEHDKPDIANAPATHTDDNSGGKHESARRVADTQGPQTPEQIKAVQEFLLEHGPKMGLEGNELLQTMLSVPTNPLEFADILAEIQQATPPPAPPHQDAGMSANPPAPAQEEAPPEATMPMPGMSQQMTGAVAKYAADSVADRCPNCKGHTTKLLDGEDGTSMCHGCGTVFKTKGKHLDKMQPTSRWILDADIHRHAAGDLPSPVEDPAPVQGVSIADQQGQPHTGEPHQSPHSWTDENGNPLQVGQEYEMYSAKFDIPDLVRVEAVKPHGGPIEYTLMGEYGLQHSTELTREEADLDGTTFRPTTQAGDQTGDPSLEENNDDNTGYSGEPEQNDMSAPGGLVHASVQASGVDRENPTLSWLMEGVPRTAGANYTPMEQRALIEETGNARNADSLDLSGTHYISDADDEQFLFGV